MKIITTDDAIELLRGAVDRNGEDHFYPFPGVTCEYADQEGNPLCIVGDALLVGISSEWLRYFDGGPKGIAEIIAKDYALHGFTEYGAFTPRSFVIGDEIYRFESGALRVLIAAQNAQDDGQRWGAALAAAEHERDHPWSRVEII